MKKLLIKVGARSSPLSKAQVQEVYSEIHPYCPHIEFENIYVETTGDKDRATSLRTLDKTDFFTKELDHLLLNGGCRIAVHSAKDLPDPLPKGLTIAAITKGVDPADVLVLRPGESLETLPAGAHIATSSVRREEQVRQLRHDLNFCDLRGTIGERLTLLENGQADGVVLAEAALIRLGLTHLNRIRLPGETAPYQGQLAILCRESDAEMLDLFYYLDTREKKKILYLGLDLPEMLRKQHSYIHYPIIRIHIRSPNEPGIQDCFKDIPSYTHFLFTSKSAVHAFFHHLSYFGYKSHHIHGKNMICVGQQTAKTLKAYGIPNPLISPVETAEGMVDFLQNLSLKNPYFFWPHSAISRPIISDFLIERKWSFKECKIYDTVVNKSLPHIDLRPIDEIYFTSPSTIDAFIEVFGSLPKDKVLKTIGPVTEKKLMFLVKPNS